ncbi:MAG: hypothetical protein L6408_08515, partial [Nanoarchaeota archaeon]|nr:hypothetical protein [Nanoarchaeota archaeon]
KNQIKENKKTKNNTKNKKPTNLQKNTTKNPQKQITKQKNHSKIILCRFVTVSPMLRVFVCCDVFVV